MKTSLLKIAAAGLAASGCVASASVALAGTTGAPPATRPPKTFIAITPASPARLAVYSAATGRLEKYLTAARRGHGISDPELSASGRNMFFLRGHGICGQTVDTVPATGGAKRVLIPMTGAGRHAQFPESVSASADGKYLLYNTTGCVNDTNTLYLRNLRTGRTAKLGTTASPVGSGAVFIDHDRQVVYQGPGALAVLNLHAMRLQYVTPSADCPYGPVTGTATRLTGTLACSGALRILAITPGTFEVTEVIATLTAGAPQPTSVSVAAHDPAAVLVQADIRRDRTEIVKIINGKSVVLRSGRFHTVPLSPVW